MDWFGNNTSSNLFYLTSRESALIDQEYRYKIASPIISIGGKKGNRTTLFENSEYYSEKLGVPSVYFGKYISNKISCPLSIDKEKKCISWKGEYIREQIELYLKDFIKIYILCPSCDYPETDIYLNEQKLIGQICRSCGVSSLIEAKYMDKTYDFIQKNIK
jgi:translation initiation factor 5